MKVTEDPQTSTFHLGTAEPVLLPGGRLSANGRAVNPRSVDTTLLSRYGRETGQEEPADPGGPRRRRLREARCDVPAAHERKPQAPPRHVGRTRIRRTTDRRSRAGIRLTTGLAAAPDARPSIGRARRRPPCHASLRARHRCVPHAAARSQPATGFVTDEAWSATAGSPSRSARKRSEAVTPLVAGHRLTHARL